MRRFETYEYKRVRSDGLSVRELNKYGKDGWELVTMDNDLREDGEAAIFYCEYIFKRRTS